MGSLIENFLEPAILSVLLTTGLFWFVVLPSFVFVNYFERKWSADLEARVGPNRAGPFGILQFFADGLKLLQKSRSKANKGIWQIALFAVLFCTLSIAPLGSGFLLVDADMSIFLPILVAFILAMGHVCLGFKEAKIESILSGLRMIAQVFAGAFPALICLIAVGLVAGGFKWTVIVEGQNFFPSTWNIFRCPPFLLIGFFVFWASGHVLFSIAPVNSGSESPEFRKGVFSNLSGSRLTEQHLSRYYCSFLWSLMTAVLFLGGWKIPESLQAHLSSEHADLIPVLEFLLVLFKTIVLVLVARIFGRINPKLRVDQATDLSWRILGPISLIVLIGCSLWMLRGFF